MFRFMVSQFENVFSFLLRLVADDPYQLYQGLVKILENYSEFIHGQLWTLLMFSDQHLSPNTFLEREYLLQSSLFLGNLGEVGEYSSKWEKIFKKCRKVGYN